MEPLTLEELLQIARETVDRLSLAQEKMRFIVLKLRGFAKDLEAGKARSPKELRKLIGSLSRQNDDLFWAINFYRANPMFALAMEIIRRREGKKAA